LGGCWEGFLGGCSGRVFWEGVLGRGKRGKEPSTVRGKEPSTAKGVLGEGGCSEGRVFWGVFWEEGVLDVLGVLGERVFWVLGGSCSGRRVF
jgi:hypothetical protein